MNHNYLYRMRKNNLIFTALLMLSSTLVNGAEKVITNDYPIEPVSFVSVKMNDNFWAPRIKTNQETTIPIALKQCYITGRVDNFKKAAGLMPGYFNTQFTFDDTDIYKIIEGASYSIQMYPNKELDAKMDTLIGYIAKAQEPDGYLYTARTAGEPGKLHEWVGEKRWEKDPDLSHELYNCGHLYEAASAHYLSTGKRTLLDVAIKSADLLVKDFGPGKLAYEPGHQIVEMGLVKMYRITHKKEYLDLAKYFLDLRGKGQSGEYSQTHKPVIEQDEAVGHAVRANYMYSGMADVAALTGNDSYLKAIDRIWENVVGKKLYITGGCGATGNGEAYGENYDLPNMSAYCETCAAIANVYWNYRLFLLHGESKYYDVLERTLYNGVLSGISLSGDRFFYPNPLESVGQHGRSEWFGCACCPSNMCRFIASVPGYMYAHKDNNIYINLFAQSETDIQVGKNAVKIIQETGYPWCGDVKIKIEPTKTSQFGLMVRIPGWAKNKPVPSDLYSYLNAKNSEVKIKLNGKDFNYSIDQNGYVSIDRKWKKGDQVELSFPMDVKRVIANDKVEDDRGKVSLERGPIVYCLEWPDNNEKVINSVLDDAAEINFKYVSDLNGIVKLEAKAKATLVDKDQKTVTEDKFLTAVPYYTWANRGSGEMAVWIPRFVEASKPLPMPTICTNAKVKASTPNRSLSSINDGYLPKHSNDRKVPFYSIWPKSNTSEWIEYTFEKPETFSTAEVYWFDDGPWGGCRIPLSWKIQYANDKDEWLDVKNKEPYISKKDALNTVSFETVTSKKVRVVFQLPEKESCAAYEFQVK
jgi:DUF1680 family protein